MLKKIGLVLVVLVAGVLLFAATRPDSFRVERSAAIKAPPDKLFALVHDLREWPKWSPWEKRDPAMQRTLGGAPAGPGATYEWKGNKEVGHGRMEITGTTPPSLVVIRLDFYEPFAATNTTEFRFVPEGDATRVTWAMHGPSPYVSKLMGLVFDMDQMIGRDFVAGLANLKSVAER